VRQHEEAHQPPPESEYIPFAFVEVLYQLIAGDVFKPRGTSLYGVKRALALFIGKERFFVKTGITGPFKRVII